MNAIQGKQAFQDRDEPVGRTPPGAAPAPDRPRRRGRWLWLLILAAALAAGAYYVVQRDAEAPAPAAVPQAQTPTVMRLDTRELLTVAPSDRQQTARITGTLRPASQAIVSTRSAGTLEAVHVQPGDRVSQGDVLAELDTAELALQIEQQTSTIRATQVQLSLAESQLETSRALVERGSSPRSALDSAQSNVDGLVANLAAQEAQLASLELTFANATIRAPFAGTVSERSADPGQAVNPGTPVVTLVDTSRMEVAANASLSDAINIAVGQEVRIVVESLAHRQLTGTVDRINPVAPEGTRSLPVYLTLDNADGMLRGGMFVTGQIVVAEARDVIAVPARAVLQDGEGAYVLVLENDRLVRRAVETGQSWENARVVEISSGLASGDVIVGQALTGLGPDMPVSIEGI